MFRIEKIVVSRADISMLIRRRMRQRRNLHQQPVSLLSWRLSTKGLSRQMLLALNSLCWRDEDPSQCTFR
jgi:hypothetical protein